MKSNLSITSIALLSVLLLGSFLALASAVQTFTVPNLSTQTVSLNLNKDDTVTGSITVSGGTGNDITFTIQDPSGNTIATYSHTTSNSFQFTASQTGTYKLVFDNTFSLLASKSITLDYSVQSALLWSSIIIAVVAVIIIIVAIIVVKKRAKSGTITPIAYQTPPPPPPS
jgi:hypothetical protein